MKRTTLLNLLLLSCISFEALATNNEDPEDNFHKRKINNIEEIEDQGEKRHKRENQNDWFKNTNIAYLEEELKNRLTKNNEYTDPKRVFKKFYSSCLKHNRDDDFENQLKSFMSDFFGSARFKANQEPIKILAQLICLNNVCKSIEFKSIVENLSLSFYDEDEGWSSTSTYSDLSLVEVLSYILFHKGIEVEINIDEVKEKLQKEGNNILPDFLRNTLKDNSNNNLISNLNTLPPEFKTTEEVRNYFGIRKDEVINIDKLNEARKYSKKLGENLLPENFHVRVSYPKKQKLLDIDDQPSFLDTNKWDYVDKFIRFYLNLTQEATKLKDENLLSQDEFILVFKNIYDQQALLNSRHLILSMTKNMIMRDQFTSYIFSNNTASIHIENGYLDSRNIFQGYVQRDGTPDFDGVQIEERLKMYDHIYFQTYSLASELGKDSVVSFFKEFTRAQCLDGRIYPIQNLLYNLQERKNIQENMGKIDNQLDKKDVLNNKFMEYYSSNPEDTKEGIISKMIEFFSDEKIQIKNLSQNEITDFVNGKFAEIGC